MSRSTTQSAYVTPLTLSVPERLVSPPSWMGHIPFAFWAIGALKPRVLVELGVHTGVSYCAFCQAAEQIGAQGRYFGVDHWRGDSHAGEYQDEVYDALAAYHDPRYSDFSTLVRSSFDDALEGFEDGEVDLLHIDGWHTYEAVSHDFETWKDKLSGRAVVLFHDIAVRKDDFGVWRFWKEVSEQYPSFGFTHSNGLGVLGVGDDLPGPVAEFFETAQSPEGAADLRRLFSRLGAGVSATYKAGQFETDEIVPMRNHIGNLERELSGLRQTHEELAQEAESRLQQLIDLRAKTAIYEQDHHQVRALSGETERLRAQLEAAQARLEELPGLRQRCEEAEATLASVRSAHENELDQLRGDHEDELDRLRKEVEDLEGERRRRRGEQPAAARQVMAQIEAEAHERGRLYAEIARIQSTTMWRLAAPFRMISRRAPRLAARAGILVRFALSILTLRVFAQAKARKRRADMRAEDRFVILESDLFHQDWYLAAYPDVTPGPLSALEHYLKHGVAEGRDPNPWFDTDWYLAANPDVRTSGRNPLAHYVLEGEAEGRPPNPLFLPKWYRKANPDAAGERPLAHYIAFGHAENRAAHPLAALTQEATGPSAAEPRKPEAEPGGARAEARDENAAAPAVRINGAGRRAERPDGPPRPARPASAEGGLFGAPARDPRGGASADGILSRRAGSAK